MFIVISGSTDKSKYFTLIFDSNSALDDKYHPLPNFTHLTEQILGNKFISARKDFKLIKRLDLNKATEPDKILVVVLKNINREFSRS